MEEIGPNLHDEKRPEAVELVTMAIAFPLLEGRGGPCVASRGT